MTQPQVQGCGARRLVLVAFVGQAAPAAAVGRVVRLVRGSRPAAAAFMVPGADGEARAIGFPELCLDGFARAQAPGSPLLGGLDWGDGASVRSGRAVFGVDHLCVASAASRGPRAFELARWLRDRWVPPLHLSVARIVSSLRAPVTLIAATTHEPGRLVAASSGAPLSVAVAGEGVLVSSDVEVALAFSKHIVLARPEEMAVVDADGFDLLCMRTLARVPRSSLDLGLRVPMPSIRTSPIRPARARQPDPGASAGEAA